MKKFLALLNVSFRSMLVSGGRGRGKRKKTATGFGAAALIAGLGMYISGAYSYMLMSVLAPLHMEILVFVFMGLAALFGGMMFTAFGASATLYGGRDNDLLLSMPVSDTVLTASRVAAIYLENWLFSFFMLAPAGVACALMSQSGAGRSVGFWIGLVLTTFLLPMLDTVLSVLVGALIAGVSGRMKRRAMGQNLLMGAYLLAIFWVSFNLPDMVNGLALNAHSVLGGMGWAAPAVWMARGILGDWAMLGAFAAVCILPFALTIWLLGKSYRRIVTAFRAASADTDYRLSSQGYSGRTRALLRKEAARLFGTPIYLWNCALGFVMLVALGVVAVVNIDALPAIPAMGDIRQFALPAACAVMGFILALCPICAFSVSLEGRQLWILKSAPVSVRWILWMKTGFQIGLALPFILIYSALMSAALWLSLPEGLLLAAFGVLFECFDAALCMLLGLVFPQLERDDAAVIKRSLLSFLAIFLPMIFLGLAALPVWLLWETAGAAAAVSAGFAVQAALLAVCAALLHLHGPRLFESL